MLPLLILTTVILTNKTLTAEKASNWIPSFYCWFIEFAANKKTLIHFYRDVLLCKFPTAFQCTLPSQASTQAFIFNPENSCDML